MIRGSKWMVLGSKSKVARGSKFILNSPKQVLTLCPALYIYIYTYGDMYGYNGIYIYVYIYMYICIYVYIYVYMYIYMYLYVYMVVSNDVIIHKKTEDLK